ncbi:AzlD domain-containing protein [Desulfonispora thiosulfatigenes]|nr:AzlD domain-containing protein [Desulfonispora thiosulfatigenes]
MNKVVLTIIFMTVVTYIPRFIPITFCRGQLNSKFLNSFLYYVPYAVLGALIFPDILNSTPHTISAVIGGISAIILAFMNKGLMTVVIGAIAVVYICEKLI